jgi:hypothetical protein
MRKTLSAVAVDRRPVSRERRRVRPIARPFRESSVLPVTAMRAAFCFAVLILQNARAGAQRYALTPQGLAQSWTGTHAPTCTPKRATSSTSAGSEYCIWRRGAETWDSVEVSGTRYPDARVTHVVWARRIRDSASAEAVGDSIGRALVAQGLTFYPCAFGARAWLSPGLAVYFSIGGEEKPAKTRRAAIQVVDDPTAIPTWACPDLPGLTAPQRTLRVRAGIDVSSARAHE